MSTQAKFFFTGNSDQFTKALSQVKKSMKQVANQTVVLQAALKVLSGTIKTVAKTLTNVLGAAVRGIVNLISAAIRTIKNLITGVVKFVKSALTTLLSWITKALGKIFDWLGNTIKKLFSTMASIASTAIKIAKKAVKEVVDSVQKYADKEYNQIQLKVSLGDSYDSVIKDFNKLVRYTTADRNDLLSVYSTFAELGKSPQDVVKYAKATVYLSNATGRSLSQITRLLLGQEAAGRDLQKVLGRIGITLSGNEESISNIDKIIAQLDDEMNALANGSLNQVFANIKNDVIAIKENIGQIFSGPVRYVAQKIDELLTRLTGSSTFDSIAKKINDVFEKVKPYIDKVFDFLNKIVQDPAGFLDALWSDIKSLWDYITSNWDKYLKVFSVIIGHAVRSLTSIITDFVKNTDWLEIGKNIASGIGNLTANVALGAGLITEEQAQEAEGSIKKVFIAAWNNAVPDFQMSSEDPWYTNFTQLLRAAWQGIKTLWDEWEMGDKLDSFKDKFLETWNDKIVPTLVTTFQYIGDVLGTAIHNALLKSDVIRSLINFLPGVNYVVYEDAQKRIFEEMQNLLPEGFKASDITRDFLMSMKDKNQTWLYYLMARDKDNSLQKDFTAFRQNQLLTYKEYTPFSDYVNKVSNIWNPKDIAQSVVDANRAFREADKSVEEASEKVGASAEQIASDVKKSLITLGTAAGIGYAGVKIGGKVLGGFLFSAGKSLFNSSASMTKAASARYGATGTMSGFGSGGGGSMFFNKMLGMDESSIPRFAKGGLVHKPTLALIGEDGPEIVIPVKNLARLSDGNDPSNGVSFWEGDVFENAQKEAGVTIESYSPTALKEWSEATSYALGPVLESILDKTGGELSSLEKAINWTKKAWKNITSKEFWEDVWSGIVDVWYDVKGFLKDIGKTFSLLKYFTLNDWGTILDGIWSGLKTLTKSYIGKSVGFLAQNGAFGNHLGNIFNNSFDENGTFSILQMFSAIIQELIPYLQKGLELVGTLFDEAFEILANAVMILGERLGKELLPILEAFVPFMKTLADIVIALAPVAESILKPAVMIIAAILQVLTGVLDKLMPVFAALGAVIQWVCDAISFAVGSVINWLASWIPWVSTVDVKRPTSIKENYNNIMGTYNASKANTVSTPTTSSVGTASATASYNGATTVYMTNDFSGAYVVGSNGFRELALIIKNTLEDIDYSGQSV